jgi:hypothetical protein
VHFVKTAKTGRGMRNAQKMDMTLTMFAIISGVIWISTALLLLWAVRRAPVGYQDESGFHYGAESSKTPAERTGKRTATSEKFGQPAHWATEEPSQVAAH